MSQGPHTNSSTRDMLNTADPNAIRIVYRAPISEKYLNFLTCIGICSPCSCIYCKRKEIFQSTYVQVHENRLEYNYPGLSDNMCANIATCCKVRDVVTVWYFDNAMTGNVGRASFCQPICTHNTCFPTCCDMCGEAVVVYKRDICKRICCGGHIMIPNLENADALVDQIKGAAKAKPTSSMSKD